MKREFEDLEARMADSEFMSESSSELLMMSYSLSWVEGFLQSGTGEGVMVSFPLFPSEGSSGGSG